MQFPDVCRRCREAGADFMAVPYWMPIAGKRSPSELIAGDGAVLAAANREKAQFFTGFL